MTMAMIGARVKRMDVSRASRQAQILGTDSRATVVRYALRRVAGISHDQAMVDAKLSKMNDRSMIAESGQVTATLPEEWIREAYKAVPEIKNDAMLVRYALLIMDDYSREEALDEAMRHIGRPRGSKNKTKAMS